jgi:hypothetical protein
MKRNEKPVKKSHEMTKKDKASYQEPMRPKKPNCSSSKGKMQDGQMKARKK